MELSESAPADLSGAVPISIPTAGRVLYLDGDTRMDEVLPALGLSGPYFLCTPRGARLLTLTTVKP